MSSNKPSATVRGDDHAHDLLVSPAQLFGLQRQLRGLVARLVSGTHAQEDYIAEFNDLKALLLKPAFWDRFRRFVPELDVHEHEISADGSSPLVQFQEELMAGKLLRPPIVEPSLTKIDLRDRELWQDLGYFILPLAMHKPWHDLVNEEFQVSTPFVCISHDNDRAQALPREQLLAYYDRVFQQIRSFWLWRRGPQTPKTEAMEEFIKAYESYRTALMTMQQSDAME